MRIAVDAACWANRRGFGRFTREMCRAMFPLAPADEFLLLTDGDDDLAPGHDNVRSARVDVRRTVRASAVAGSRRTAGDMLRFSWRTRGLQPDVIFFPAVYSWYPTLDATPSVVVLHDAIAEQRPELIFPDRRSRLFWTLKVALARRQARRLVTVSAAAREQIARHFGIEPAQIEVVSEGAHPRFRPPLNPEAASEVRHRHQLPQQAPFVLYVGPMAPHKNVANLVTGFARAAGRPGLTDTLMVLAGDPEGDGFHADVGEVRRRIDADPMLRERVRWLGFVEDDDLPSLYAAASALALPSVSEGFGLPALEAMSCGTPVLCSDVGSVPEVAGDACLTFAPDDPDAIADAIERIVIEPGLRPRLARAALERAGCYSWRRGAERMLAILREAAG